MFMAIFDFDINLLYESVIYVSCCMFVHAQSECEKGGSGDGSICTCTEITGYAIINRFIAIRYRIYCFHKCVNCALCEVTFFGLHTKYQPMKRESFMKKKVFFIVLSKLIKKSVRGHEKSNLLKTFSTELQVWVSIISP